MGRQDQGEHKPSLVAESFKGMVQGFQMVDRAHPQRRVSAREQLLRQANAVLAAPDRKDVGVYLRQLAERDHKIGQRAYNTLFEAWQKSHPDQPGGVGDFRAFLGLPLNGKILATHKT